MTKRLFVWAIAALLVAGTGCSKENEPKDDNRNNGTENSEQTGGEDSDKTGDDTEEAPVAEMDIFSDLFYDELVYVEGGTFLMGAQADVPNGLNYDSDAYDFESPIHEVTLDSYYIGKYEVTQGLWKKVMGTNPSYFKGDDNLPVENVSWNDCQEFISRLNEMTGKNYRLPTEAEWEYAARGGQEDEYTRTLGQSGTYYKYAGNNTIGDVAWYGSNSSSKTHPVGLKAPNALGLYDMTGNVYEWCSDWYSSSYYSGSPAKNPAGPATGSNRVLRGGSWYYDAQYCRVSIRANLTPDYRNYDYGLRLVLPL